MTAALDAGTPQIGALVREFGTNPVELYVAGCIVQLRDFVNLRGAMNNDQTDETAALAVADFPNLTIADIALIFRRVRKGDYGELYGRLDGQVILGWFSKYQEERCQACAMQSESEGNAAKSGYTRQLGDKAAWKFAEELTALNRKKLSSPCPPPTDGGKN